MRKPPPAPLLLDTGRLQSLSNAMFAIVMTLRVFDIHVPALERCATLSTLAPASAP